MKRIVTTMLMGTLLLGVVGCRPNGSSSSSEGFYATALVQRDRISVTVRAVGQVEPLASRTLTFGTVGGQIAEVLVHEGDQVREGEPLVRLDTEELERHLVEAQADLRVAEAELAAVRREPGEVEIATAQAAVTQAEAVLAEAELELADATGNPLASLEAVVADATHALQEARDRLALEEFRAGQPEIRNLEYEEAFFQRALRDLPPREDPTDLDKNLRQVSSALARARASREEALAARRKAVSEAEAALDEARRDLAQARAGATDPVAKLELAVERAREKLAEAQNQLDALRAGADPDVVERATNAYEAALAKVEDIEADIVAATLTSPIDGAILSLFVQPGRWVGPSTNVAYVADASELTVTAQVSEQDVVALEPGQVARVTFESAPHTFYEGTLTTVGSRAQTSDGMAVFEVTARLGAVDFEVLPGMMASLWVNIGTRDDVLVIPATAVLGTDYYRGRATVMVRDDDGAWVQREVGLGTSDGILIEVLDGLSEGDEIRVPLQSPGSTQPYLG